MKPNLDKRKMMRLLILTLLNINAQLFLCFIFSYFEELLVYLRQYASSIFSLSI